METLLSNTQLSYKLVRNKIIIYQADKKETAANETTLISAEQYDGGIKGKITNEKGEPISGASILLIGIDKGTAADNLGEFTLMA